MIQNQQAIDAQFSLTGRRREEIMACAGIPDAVHKTGDKEIAIFSVETRHIASGAVLGQAHCTVSFVFEAGRVSAVSYAFADPGILAPLESCAEIIAGCLR